MSDTSSVPSTPLVGVRWLADHLEDPRVRIVDCRWYLGGRRGVDEYARGHIPGAVHLDVDVDLAGSPQVGPGRHPLPDAGAFARTLARAGIAEGSIVVAYDDAGGAIAARLWWLLRYFSHPGGHVLNGGLQAWTAEGHPVSSETPAIAPAPVMQLVAGGALVADKATVDRYRSDRSTLLLDARASERYEGRSEPIDARAGHIPGARSAPFVANLSAPAGSFLDLAILEQRYRELGALDARAVVCYCGSGVTACHDLLALALIGRADAILYEGSWSDWARDADLPAASGPEP